MGTSVASKVVIGAGAVAVLLAVTGCHGNRPKSAPAAPPVSAKPVSLRQRAQTAVSQVNVITPLQQATNFCVQAINQQLEGSAVSDQEHVALDALLPQAGVLVDVVGIAGDSVTVQYDLKNGQPEQAEFDAGKMIFAILGVYPGLELFGQIGDAAVYCTEAAFWLTGNLGGQLGAMLRQKLDPPGTVNSSIEGTWSLIRGAPTICHIFSTCADSPLQLAITSCTATQCDIQRVGSAFDWKSAHPIIRAADGTWSGSFSDVAVDCPANGTTYVNPASISITLTPTTASLVNGVLTAQTLGGSYKVVAATNPPNCKSGAYATYAMYGGRT